MKQKSGCEGERGQAGRKEGEKEAVGQRSKQVEKDVMDWTVMRRNKRQKKRTVQIFVKVNESKAFARGTIHTFQFHICACCVVTFHMSLSMANGGGLNNFACHFLLVFVFERLKSQGCVSSSSEWCRTCVEPVLQ